MEEVQDIIPYDVLLEILSRLPIESIIRFKSVCKSWCNLINNPLFVELQLRRSKSQPPRLVLCDTYGYRINKLIILHPDKKRNMLEAGTISLECKNKMFDVHIIGSCNGLICKISAFQHRCCGVCHTICVCNPITKECVVLPLRSGLTYVGVPYIDSGIFGFGVDSTGKYKVIQILNKDGLWKGEIITLGESSWRELEIPFPLYKNPDKKLEVMLFMNGTLYCIIRKFINHQLIILVFDIHDEKFRTMAFHVRTMMFHVSLSLYEFGLTVCKDSLVLYQSKLSSGVRLWMIEINKKAMDNWRYQFAYINKDELWPNDYFQFNIVGMLSKNMLLFKVDEKLPTALVSHLVVYCMEKKKLLRNLFSGSNLRSFHINHHVPSLESPILIACGKAKKDTGSDIFGLDIEVVGYSSLSEFMDSHWMQHCIIAKQGYCIIAAARLNASVRFDNDANGF